ncbi:MAG TPA: hypothetical protein VGG06_05465 [Thermoanaerobaculia bacterium]|jgi:hypothetical protein
MIPKSSPALLAFALTLLLVTPLVADPLPWGPECGAVRCPGATLLIPYFEVDLDDSGRTTLFSIANADFEPALVRVVVWTNWGIPALGFNVLLAPDELRSIHLGKLLATGALPVSHYDDPFDYPGCPSQLAPATLDAQALATLKARLTGQPDLDDGQCYSEAVEDGLATGYVTVDAVRRCSDTARFPGDAGYFAAGNQGVASDRNVLWGDVLLLDDARDRADGFEAVALRADAERFGTGPGQVPGTFYDCCTLGEAPSFDDHRTPLSATYRTRVLGAKTLGTQLLVWTQGQPETRYPDGGPLECGASPKETYVGMASRDEAGGGGNFIELTTALRTQRLDLEDFAELEGLFGTLDLCTKHRSAFGFLSPPTRLFQTWVVPLLSLRDRFSVGYHAAPVREPGVCG